MLIRIHSDLAPPATRTSWSIDDQGRPRFWGAVWSSLVSGGLADSTYRGNLAHVDAFYDHADLVLGQGQLDKALGGSDIASTCQALESFFISLSNKPELKPSDDKRWHVALEFVRKITGMIERGDTHRRLHELETHVARLTQLYATLRVTTSRRNARIRALTGPVVEALFELLDPASSTNPFRNDPTSWRVFIVFICMLHLGLRRGELLLLPVDALHDGIDPKTGKTRFWLDVVETEYEDDGRYSRPAIKTAESIRQIPVTAAIAHVIDSYTQNYRGRPDHSFLMNSQRNRPLSTEGLTKHFQRISKCLPAEALADLHARTKKTSVTPHDLRHTCATFRLNQLLRLGTSMDEALQQLRGFFGWSKDSSMPRRYAKAAFDERLNSVWNDAFDERVEVIRAIKGQR